MQKKIILWQHKKTQGRQRNLRSAQGKMPLAAKCVESENIANEQQNRIKQAKEKRYYKNQSDKIGRW